MKHSVSIFLKTQWNHSTLYDTEKDVLQAFLHLHVDNCECNRRYINKDLPQIYSWRLKHRFPSKYWCFYLHHLGMNVEAGVAQLGDLLGQELHPLGGVAEDNWLIDLKLWIRGKATWAIHVSAYNILHLLPNPNLDSLWHNIYNKSDVSLKMSGSINYTTE